MVATQEQAVSNGEQRDTRFQKTQLCSFFREGRCRFGRDCTFAHSRGELTSAPDLKKTCLCKRWKDGACPLPSAKCPFAHGWHDLRSKSNVSKSQLPTHVPAPAKQEYSPTTCGIAAKLSEPAKVRPEATRVDLCDLREPIKVVTRLSEIDEPIKVIPLSLGGSGRCFEPIELSEKIPLPFPWDRWDNETASGETSSEDDGGCNSPHSSEADVVDGNHHLKMMHFTPPPGLDEAAVVHLSQYV